MIDPGERIADRYEVEAVLGEGGLARVYRVRHIQLGGTFALKHLWMTRQGLQERLLREGRIQSQLDHVNVVKVLDVLDIQGQPGLLMEFVDGPTLQELLVADGPMALEPALALFAQVLAGMAAAHAAGVLHRDLKPANILVARGSRGPVAKVADFGIAKVATGTLGPGRTAAGMRMGTPGYMAPEQVTDAAGAALPSDIFALGVILYEMLTGKNPFRQEGVAEAEFHTLSNTVEGRYAPLSQVLVGCPEEVVEVVQRAMKVEPGERYGSCLAMAQDLFGEDPELLSQVEEASKGREGGIAAALPSAGTSGHRPTMVPGTIEGPSNPTMAPPLTEELASPGAAAETIELPTEEPASGGLGLGLGLGAFMVAGLVLVVLGGGALGLFLYGNQDTDGSVIVNAPLPEAPGAVAELRRPEEAMVRRGDEAPSGGEVEPGPEPVAQVGAGEGSPASTDRQVVAASRDVASTAPVPAPARAVPAEAAAVPQPAEEAEAEEEEAAPVAAAADASPGEVEDDGLALAEVAPDEAEAPPEAAPQAEANRQLVNLRGTWRGEANNLPFTLRVVSQDGPQVRAEVTFVQGPTQRTVIVAGTIDPLSGAIRLAEDGGTQLVFTGLATTSRVAGTYTRAGQRKSLSWSVQRL